MLQYYVYFLKNVLGIIIFQLLTYIIYVLCILMTLLTSQKFLTIILRVEIADDRLAVRKKEAHPLG